MSELAKIHLRQARSFARVGDQGKAVELLEKARVLARGEPELAARILEQLAESYDAVGKVEQATRCREQLARLPQRGQSPVPAPTHSFSRPPSASRSHKYLMAAALVLMLAFTGSILWWNSMRAPARVAGIFPSTAPSAFNGAEKFGGPLTQPSTLPENAALPPAAGSAAAIPPPPQADRQEVLKDAVGLMFVLAHYEGPTYTGNTQIDLALASGTAFAVSSTGLMVTNRHVAEAATELKPPVTLEQANLPTVTLRGISYMICFGPDPKDRYPAKLLHKSDTYDLAIMRIDRHFRQPLALATKELRQSDDILVCGYPGAVMAAMNQASITPERIVEVSRKWQTSRHIDAFDEFSPEIYNSTVTKGIVSAPERNIKNVGYMQIDAVISAGNSGGPVLNLDNEVVGIATWGLQSGAAGGSTNSYNFALLVKQLVPELHPYLKE